MRLSAFEKKSIKKIFKDVFKKGEVYLFGSRIDDSKKGGDIDLYINLPSKLDIKEMLTKKSEFKIKLQDKIGEQKIDVIISKNKNSLVEKEALKNGIEL